MKSQSSQKSLIQGLAFVICGFASLFYLYEYFLRVTASAITYNLMQEFRIDAKTLGFMSALFYYGYTPMQIPAGLLVDRFGPRILISICTLLCGLGAMIFGWAHDVWMLGLGRLIAGVASSAAFIGVLVLATRWFKPKYFALITGIVQLMGCLGAIMGEGPVALLTEQFGWRRTLVCTGGVGIILSLLFWLVIRDAPRSSGQGAKNMERTNTNPLKAQPSKSNLLILMQSLKQEWQRLACVCKNPQTWLIGLVSFCCWSPIVTFAALWGIPFLVEDYHISVAAASTLTATVWIGIGLAGPLIGWWSNAISSRRIPLIVGGLLGFVASLGIIYFHRPPYWLMNVCLFLLGAAGSAQAVAFGLVQDINPPRVVATAIGFNNMAVIFGGMTVQPLTGVLLKFFWEGQLVQGVPHYTFATYEKALSLMPVCSFFALIMALFFIKETHCKVQYDYSSE